MVERPDIQEKIRRVKLPYHNDVLAVGRRIWNSFYGDSWAICETAVKRSAMAMTGEEGMREKRAGQAVKTAASGRAPPGIGRLPPGGGRGALRTDRQEDF